MLKKMKRNIEREVDVVICDGCKTEVCDFTSETIGKTSFYALGFDLDFCELCKPVLRSLINDFINNSSSKTL